MHFWGKHGHGQFVYDVVVIAYAKVQDEPFESSVIAIVVFYWLYRLCN